MQQPLSWEMAVSTAMCRWNEVGLPPLGPSTALGLESQAPKVQVVYVVLAVAGESWQS